MILQMIRKQVHPGKIRPEITELPKYFVETSKIFSKGSTAIERRRACDTNWFDHREVSDRIVRAGRLSIWKELEVRRLFDIRSYGIYQDTSENIFNEKKNIKTGDKEKKTFNKSD